LAELREKIKIIRIIGRLNIGGPARNAVLLTEGLTGGDCGSWEKNTNIATTATITKPAITQFV